MQPGTLLRRLRLTSRSYVVIPEQAVAVNGLFWRFLPALHSFRAIQPCTDGANPVGGLFLDSNGGLYGNHSERRSAQSSPTREWNYTVLHNFVLWKIRSRMEPVSSRLATPTLAPALEVGILKWRKRITRIMVYRPEVRMPTKLPQMERNSYEPRSHDRFF
jgi:hypothetical protein